MAVYATIPYAAPSSLLVVMIEAYISITTTPDKFILHLHHHSHILPIPRLHIQYAAHPPQVW